MSLWNLHFHRKTREEDLEEEVQAHLRMAAQERIEHGEASSEARTSAVREFGNVAVVKEVTRQMWGFGWLETLLQDLRYGLRQLRRNSGFAAVAILTLALGIGVNTAMFSVLNAVIFRPLPYRSPDQLAMLWTERPSQNLREGRSAYWNAELWRRQSESFTDMAFWDPVSMTLTTAAAEHVSGVRVSPTFFGLLGVQPELGRTFSAEEAEQRQRLAVISHRFWQTRFAGPPEALGASIELDGLPYRIIGVIPERFQFAITGADVWLPHTTFPDWEARRTERGRGSWFVIGRLRPNVTFEQAQAEMNTIARRLDSQLPASERNLGVSVVPLSLQVTGPRLRLALWMLMGAVFFVLLIAGTNVASLLLARGAGRESEIAIRSALGASRGRIVRQLLAESLTLAAISGPLGLLVAWAGIHFILVLRPGDLARLNQVDIDLRVLGWALALCLLTGILVGLAPAITMVRGTWSVSAQEGGRSISVRFARGGIRRALVVTEFALSIILLVGAGLLIRSLWSVENVDPGFRPDLVLSAGLSTPASMGNAQRVNFYNLALEQIDSLPGVETAGIIENLFIHDIPEQTLTAEGSARTASERLRFRSDEVGGGFFKALGTPLLRGRFFSAEDGPNSPRVAIINEAMARRLWPGRDPVGRRFKFGPGDSESEWFTVVGVVGNMRRQGLEIEPIPQMFEPLAQDPSRLATLLVRTSRGDPLKLAGALLVAVQRVDKQVLVYGVATLENQLRDSLGQRRFQTSLLVGFAAIALALACVGLYGMMSYAVAQRTHEIGIRMALGAQKSDVLRMVVAQGLKLTLIGVGVGIVGAFGLTRFLSSLLYGVQPGDPPTFIAVSLILTAVALVFYAIP